MSSRRPIGFVRGFFMGVALSLCAGFLVTYLVTLWIGTGLLSEQWLSVMPVVDWVQRNLGLSVVPFVIVLGLYFIGLSRLEVALNERKNPERVAQLENLMDIWISLFFGIGVIWTAIGMRAALLYALGDPGDIDGSDASDILRRLVEGGILTALSTTILGGIGGYLMGLGKTLRVGVKLNRYYDAREQTQVLRVETLLDDIRRSLVEVVDNHKESSTNGEKRA
ncbi:MAG: hypothetical protein GY703_15705 [Gammaproteobacteria bacterium]|nr:hypothetical protein [Gammaproteobacteria bacterium]